MPNIAKGSFTEELKAILVRRGAVDADSLQKALEQAASEGKTLEQYLLAKNIINETDFALALAEYLNLTPISLTHFTRNRICWNLSQKRY